MRYIVLESAFYIADMLDHSWCKETHRTMVIPSVCAVDAKYVLN